MRTRGHVFREFDTWGFDHKGWARRTREKYFQTALRAEIWLVANRGCSIHRATPKDFQAFLFSTSPNARNRNNVRQALVAFCGFLVSTGRAGENWASGLPRLPEPRSLPKAFSAEEARKVLGAARAHSVRGTVLTSVMLYAGLRKTEARTLERRHLAGDYLQIVGKGSKGRSVPIHPDLGRVLRPWVSALNHPRWIFPSDRTEGPLSETGVRVILAEIGEMADLHLHPHRLRHTFATLLVEQGVEIDAVQKLLGHASMKTTELYLTTRPARLREAVERLPLGAGAARTVETLPSNPGPTPLLYEQEAPRLRHGEPHPPHQTQSP